MIKKFCSVFSAAAVFAASIIFPFAEAQAAPTGISVSGGSTPGSPLAIEGSGFAPGETVRFSMIGNPIGQTTTDGSGGISGTATVPNLSSGTYELYATGQTSYAYAKEYFYISGFNPLLSVSSYYVLPGTELLFTGSGFASGETIDIVAADDSAVRSVATANVNGEFTNAGGLNIPYEWGNSARVFRAAGRQSGAFAEVVVSVASYLPGLMPSTYFAAPGQDIFMSGDGFAAHENVTITANGQSISATADGAGAFGNAGPLRAPSRTSTMAIAAVGNRSGVRMEVQVLMGTLYPSVTPSAWYVPMGSAITFAGSGFLPREDVVMKRGDTVLSTIPTNESGTFTGHAITTGFGGPGAETYTFTGAETGSVSEITITMAALMPYMELSTYYEQPGQTVSARGWGFAAGEEVSIAIGAERATSTADALGTVATTSLGIPFGGGSGTVDVTMIGVLSGAVAATTLTLESFWAEVWPSSWYERPGSSVMFRGTGFAPGETVGIALGATQVSTTTADTAGAFTVAANMPFTGLIANFVFTGITSGATASVPVTVASLYPGMELSMYYGNGGSPIRVFGGGFAGNETLSITFGGEAFGTTVADNMGDFSFNSTVPYLTPGEKEVRVAGQGSGASFAVPFTQAQVYAGAWLGSYAGPPGAPVSFLGSGYLPNEPVEITTDRTGGTVVHTFTADAAGNLDNSAYHIPSDFTEGNLTFTITGRYSYTAAEITYYVTGS